MTLSAHKILFSLITFAALLGFGWVLIVYVLSFRAAQWAVDRIEDGMAPRPVLRPVRHSGYRPAYRQAYYRDPYLR